MENTPEITKIKTDQISDQNTKTNNNQIQVYC